MEVTFEIVATADERVGTRALTHSPEQSLIRELQAGKEQAYRDFVKRYETRILRVAYGILGDRGDAEEIAQRVVVNVFLSIRNFGGRSSLFSWVYRIAVNECYGMLRKRRRMVSLEVQGTDSSVAAQLEIRPDPGPRCDTVMLQRDYLNRLLAAIPNRDRHLLLLREVEGLSMAELAEATGMIESSVKSRLLRARQRLARAAARLQLSNYAPGH